MKGEDNGQEMVPAMALALAANFGSIDRWRQDWLARRAALGGSGWLLLVFEPREGTLVNRSGADRRQALAGGVAILAMDMTEHRQRAVDAFMADIDWAAAYERYGQAVQGASEAFAATAEDVPGAVLLDVRRAGVFEQAMAMIPGARWCDPAAVGTWADELPADREVVVYCVYGHEVGRATALRLRAAGLKARFLRGGIDQWKDAGRPLAAKGERA